jgi:lipid-A-disaccharide synthase
VKYYIITGEPSGDVHGANLMASIKDQDALADFRYWGGEKMLSVHQGLSKHLDETSFMGFIEVLYNIRKILGLFSFAKADITAYCPDVVILIDYPGFNLRMAKWLKEKGYKVIYYITPQVWAWKANRVYDLKKYSDEIITILPFEKQFFKDRNVDVHYVGHPLLDAIPKSKWKDQENKTMESIAVLPGSRKQEVKKMLVPMLQGANKMGSASIIIAKVNGLPLSLYEDLIRKAGLDPDDVTILEGKTYDILNEADIAVVSSGTATLETAIIGVPQVVCYKGSSLSYLIARKLVDLEYISLVNLIMNKRIVPELIQDKCTPDHIFNALNDVIAHQDEIKKQYIELRHYLGDSGASPRAAKIILSSMSS